MAVKEEEVNNKEWKHQISGRARWGRGAGGGRREEKGNIENKYQMASVNQITRIITLIVKGLSIPI